MKSGLRDRNNYVSGYWRQSYESVSMKSGLGDRNNRLTDLLQRHPISASQ